MKTSIIKLAVLIIIISFAGIGISSSSFSDTEIIHNNYIQTETNSNQCQNPDYRHCPKPIVSCDFADNRSRIFLNVENLISFRHLFYEILYTTNGITKGIAGDKVLGEKSDFFEYQPILGTCSAENNCVIDKNISSVFIKLKLKRFNGEEIEIEKKIQ